MARHPLFIDDDALVIAIEAATEAAVERLAELVPELCTDEGIPFGNRLRAHLAAMLTGQPGSPAPAPILPRLVHGADAFGDRFGLDGLPLPRAATGYAVQMLDTDTLLDRASGRFLPVRDACLRGLHDSFEDAYAAARAWLRARDATVDEYALAIVPAFYDDIMQRHVLVYGVLTRRP